MPSVRVFGSKGQAVSVGLVVDPNGKLPLEWQRAELFNLADEVTTALGCQYIATLNPDFISSMEAEFTKEEFKRLFTDTTVLTLKDDSPAGKLLGVQVDMHYDR